MIDKLKLAMGCSIAALGLNGAGAMAQTAPSPAPETVAAPEPAAESGLTDIIVTASRRAQSTQKTAIAVTAISSDTLTTRGISTLSEVTKLAPAVKIGQTASGNVQITLRGVGNFGGNSFAEPGVAVNLDGVYLARGTSSSGIFYDVQRVEILKGPQGTLYGRNSTGGVVNVVTNDPTDTLGGSVTAEVGNYNLLRGAAAINVPIATGISLRVAGQGTSRDGYMSDGYNDDKSYAGRVKLKLEPTDNLTILLSADYSKTKGKGNNGVFIPFVVPGQPYIGPSDPRSNAVFAALPPALSAIVPRITDQGFVDNTTRGLAATFDYDLDFAKATVIVANRTNSQRYLHYSAGFPVTDDNSDDPSESFTVEGRIASRGGQRFNWVVGAFYLNDTIHTRISPDQGNTFSQPDVRVYTKSISGFGEGTFAITPTLRLTAGGRYTSDKKSIAGTQLSAVSAPPAAYPLVCPAALGAVLAVGAVRNPSNTNTFAATCTAPAAGSATFTKFTWKVGAEFDIGPRSLLYATVATGFKAGGFYASLNTAPAGQFPNNAYVPETLIAYTLGSKNRIFDNKLQLNAEAFYWDYKNKQVPHIGIIQPGNNINLIVENAAAATVYGAELEGIWAATPRDEITFGVQYLHTEYKEFRYNVVVPAFAQNPLATPATGCSFTPVVSSNGPGTPGISTVDCSGRIIPYAPKWVFNLGARHTFPLANGNTIVAGAATHIESSFLLGDEFLAGQQQSGFTVTDLDLTLNLSDRRYSITAFVQNLEDKAVGATSFVSPSVGRPTVILRPPRTFGARFNANF